LITDVNPTDRQEYQSPLKVRIKYPANNLSAFSSARPEIPARTANMTAAADSHTPKSPIVMPKPTIRMALSAKLTGIQI
jgi:hypothetical protein